MTKTIEFEGIVARAQITTDSEERYRLVGLIKAILKEKCSARAAELEEQEFYYPDDRFIEIYTKNRVNPILGHLEIIERSGEAGYKRIEADGSIQLPNKVLGDIEIKRPVPKLHEGIDILAKQGTKVSSVLDGRIVEFQSGIEGYSNTEKGKYGNYIVIEHEVAGETIRTKYAHLSGLAPGLEERLKNNEQVEVRKGDTIGYVGMTGNAFNEPRCHLHFEIHYLDNGKRKLIDPTILHQVIYSPKK